MENSSVKHDKTRSAARKPNPVQRQYYFGVMLGLVTVLIWSVYNVGMETAPGDGFRVADIVFMRFFFGAVLLLPLFLFPGVRLPPLGKLFALCLLAGPVFAFFMASGFHFAPLSHAAVITPCTSMLVANLLVRVFDKERFSNKRLFGIAILVTGLLVTGLESPDRKVPGVSVLLGDLCFIAAGTMWASYTYLMSRWKLHPVSVAASVAGVCAIGYTPIYLWVWGLPDIVGRLWAEQIVYQGVMGGALSFVAFAATISKLGAGRAALFFSLVPASTVIMAIPMTGSQPTAVQLLSIALATVGILISLDLRGKNPGHDR